MMFLLLIACTLLLGASRIHPTPRRPRLLCRLAPGGRGSALCEHSPRTPVAVPSGSAGIAPDASVVQENKHVCQQRRSALPRGGGGQVTFGFWWSIVCMRPRPLSPQSPDSYPTTRSICSFIFNCYCICVLLFLSRAYKKSRKYHHCPIPWMGPRVLWSGLWEGHFLVHRR